MFIDKSKQQRRLPATNYSRRPRHATAVDKRKQQLVGMIHSLNSAYKHATSLDSSWVIACVNVGFAHTHAGSTLSLFTKSLLRDFKILIYLYICGSSSYLHYFEMIVGYPLTILAFL